MSLKHLENKYKKKEKDFNVLNINFSKLLYKNKNSSESQDKLLNTIDRLKNENHYLNKRLMQYSNEHNFIGVSFIAENEDDNHYLDDKCFEDILDELDKHTNKNNNYNNYNYNIYNNNQRKSYKNINIPYINKNKCIENEKYFYSSATKFYPNSYKNINNQSDVNNSNNYKINDNYFVKNLKNSFNILMNQIELSQNAKITLSSILRQLGYTDNEVIKTVGNYRGVISMPSSNNKFKK